MSRVRAPELPQDYPWLNSDRPLTLKALKGRVVILDFWTYSCINCLHVLPKLKFLAQKYKDCLTVIGVHSAKFDHEKNVANIQQAILRYDIEHPVIVDQEFQIWQQYTVKAWPTLVVIDPQGYVISSIAGEGNQNALDELIGKLLQHSEKGSINFEPLNLTLEQQPQRLTSPLAFPGKVLADLESNSLFIADSGHHRIVIATLDGAVKQLIGTGTPGLVDGDFTTVQFSSPQGMSLDRQAQTLYVADTENHAIRRIALHHQTVKTVAGTGKQSRYIYPHGGAGLDVDLNSPWDVEKVGDRLFIAMAGVHQIWQLDLASQTVETYIGTGAEFCVDGDVAQAAFAQPSGITSDGQELYIADSESSTIRAVSLGNSPQAQTVCGSGELFGFGDRDGQRQAVRLQHCLGITYAQQLWIADTYNHKIKHVDLSTGDCQTVLGNGAAKLLDGQGKDTCFYEPSGLSAAGDYLYIADTNNHAIRQANLSTLAVKTLHFPGLCSPYVCVPDVCVPDL